MIPSVVFINEDKNTADFTVVVLDAEHTLSKTKSSRVSSTIRNTYACGLCKKVYKKEWLYLKYTEMCKAKGSLSLYVKTGFNFKWWGYKVLFSFYLYPFRILLCTLYYLYIQYLTLFYIF